MRELRNSILLLLFYVIAILGVSLIQYVEFNFIDFEPAFFVSFALAAVAGIFIIPRFRPSIYIYLLIWAGIYGVLWVLIWRNYFLTTQQHVLQLILIEISAGLSYFAGLHVDEVENLLNNLSSSTYPNRALEMDEAGERINVEITRSRRFNRPLAVMVIQLQKFREKESWKRFESLQKDLLLRFALAKVGQIISGLIRQTDLIVHDRNGEFVVICPETEMDKLQPLADRISRSIEEAMGGKVLWGSASFPDETLSFEELIQKAKQRSVSSEVDSLLDQKIVERKVESKN
jgi:GGDEF domain-containing protein